MPLYRTRTPRAKLASEQKTSRTALVKVSGAAS